MTSTSVSAGSAPASDGQLLVWQWQVRVFHWAFAASIVVLFPSGLFINDPWFTAGGDTDVYLMGWVRWLHFVAAAVFCVAFVWRIAWFWLGNRHARSGFPFVWRKLWWRDLGHQMRNYLRFDFGRPHIGHNALAGLAYTVFAIGLGWGQILTGLAMFGESNPGGFCDTMFGWVAVLCGSPFRTHMWHHLFAWGFAVFVVLHVYIVLLDDRQYGNGLISSMVSGRICPSRGFVDHQVDDNDSAQ